MTAAVLSSLLYIVLYCDASSLFRDNVVAMYILEEGRRENCRGEAIFY